MDHVSAVRMVLTVALLALLITAPAAADSDLTALGTSPLKVDGKHGEARATAVLSVLNSSDKDTTADVTLQAQTDTNVTCTGSARAPARKATRVRVTCSGLNKVDGPVNGQLVVTGGSAPVAQAATVTPGLPSAEWAAAIAIGAAVAAGILSLSVLVFANAKSSRRATFWGPAPGPKWKFGESWATTLTTAGALLGTVLAGVTYPDAPNQIDKVTLTRLTLLFGGVAVLAPFLFQALRRPHVSPANPDTPLWGFNCLLLLSCALTYGAVTGQLASLALLAWELVGGGCAGKVAVGIAAFLGLVATYYFLVTTLWFAATDWPAVAAAAAAVPAPAIIGPEDLGNAVMVPVPVPTAPIRWSVP